jgi:hypothetical protein
VGFQIRAAYRMLALGHEADSAFYGCSPSLRKITAFGSVLDYPFPALKDMRQMKDAA